MKTEFEVTLRELFNGSLDTRESVLLLLNKISKEVYSGKENSIILDFTGIDFMSRSFADEFHKSVSNGDFKATLSFENMNNDILSMLKMVEKTQTIRSGSIKKPSFIKIDNLETLDDYLFAL